MKTGSSTLRTSPVLVPSNHVLDMLARTPLDVDRDVAFECLLYGRDGVDEFVSLNMA